MYRQNFKRRRVQEKRHFAEKSAGYVKSSSAYPFRLNFYDAPPHLEITVEDFEQWAIDRMKVLGEIESRMARNFSYAELETSMRPVLDKYLPLGSNASVLRAQQRDEEAGEALSTRSSSVVDIKNGSLAKFKFDETNEEHRRLKDHYSHFILRLAFCRSQELRRRFIHAESILFKIRYNSDDPEERDAFIKTCNLSWEPVTEAERQELGKKLDWLQQTREDGTDDSTGFFKVDFEKVPDLVAERRVVLHMGKAYVPLSNLRSFIMTEYTGKLERALLQTVRALPRLEEDDRLVPLLNHLAIGFEAFSTYDNRVGDGGPGTDSEIDANMVDGLADKHFPLCMQTMQRGLMDRKHLKYNARVQYGNFLRYLGLSLDAALQFWKSHFDMTDDVFDKSYRYNIRHQYGLEGSRINYRPHSCAEIANGPLPARDEYHGCPFRSFHIDNLTAALERMGIDDRQELASIKENVGRRQYHIACTRVYELTHPTDTERYNETISHPNEYFDRSWKHAKRESEVK